jgi:hypothetical protein
MSNLLCYTKKGGDNYRDINTIGNPQALPGVFDWKLE